ncbi:MAG: hypothetical protein JNJ55_07360 [Betaproteobacteria bacterium]|nr:hypothetical protein [Betaproteobacteria bacterium]
MELKARESHEVTESDRYLNPPWWHAPLMRFGVWSFVYLLVFGWMFDKLPTPVDFEGIGYYALAVLAITIGGAVSFKLDQWLVGRSPWWRWLLAGVLVGVGSALLVVVWKTSAFWMPHFER